MRCRKNIIILLGLLLLGCSPPVESPRSSSEPSQIPPKVSLPVVNQGQTLPISAKAIIGGKEINLEVAQTPQEKATGLMYRTALADDRGMLFLFQPAQPISFWMKNTLIPLDMVFLRDGIVKEIASKVPPCTSDPCPSYGAGTNVDQVIELRGGRAAELGLKVGDRVTIQKVNNPSRL